MADGLPLDASVAEGRTALKIEMGNTFEWGTPVLYMHSPDGRVFDISTEVSPVGPVQGTGAQDREGRERLSRVDELYERARRASRAEEWQAVVDIFDKIHRTSPAYPDPEGLLVLARESLTAQDHARKVAATYEEGLRHVEAKEWAQALECFGELQRLKPGYKDTEVQSELARDALAAERKHKLEKRAEEPGPRVRGEATEAVEETERGYDNPSAEDAGHGQSMQDRYHDAVRKIWERVRKSGDLYGSEVDQLKALADKLGLSKPQAEDIERRVLGDSKEVLVQDSKRGLGNTVLRKPNSLPDELRTPSNKPQGLPDDRLRDLPN